MPLVRGSKRLVRRFAALTILIVCGRTYLEWLRQGFRFHVVSGAGVIAREQEDGKRGSLDSPSWGQLVDADVLEVRGWALMDGLPPDQVNIEIDGEWVACARVGIPRLDVAKSEISSGGPACGFQALVPIKDCDAGEVVIGVAITFPDGSKWRLKSRPFNRVVPQSTQSDRSKALRLQTIDALGLVPKGPRRPGFILFSHGLDLGGGQLFVLEILRQMASKGDLNCMVVSRADGPLRRDLESLGAEVHISRDQPPNDPAVYEGRVRELATLVKASGFEVALLNTVVPFEAAEACQLAGVPTVWSIHESFTVAEWAAINYGHHHTFLAERIESALTGASALVFEADATSKLYAPYASDKFRVTVPYGVDLAEIERFKTGFDRSVARRQLDLPEDSRILLCMGVFEARKAQIPLVQAFARVCEKYSDTTLVLVGDHSCDYSTALHQVVERSGISSRVRVVDIESNIYPWYGVADLLVSASDIESLPRSFLEAMAFRVPVLSTEVYGVPELIQDSKNGWLFASRDTGALAIALDRVLALVPDRWEEIADVAFERVGRLHDSSGYAADYQALLEGFAANPTANPHEILDEVGRSYDVLGVSAIGTAAAP